MKTDRLGLLTRNPGCSPVRSDEGPRGRPSLGAVMYLGSSTAPTGEEVLRYYQRRRARHVSLRELWMDVVTVRRCDRRGAGCEHRTEAEGVDGADGDHGRACLPEPRYPA